MTAEQTTTAGETKTPGRRLGEMPSGAPRTGPRPLAYHLSLAMAMQTGPVAALPMARAGVLPWHPSLAAEAAALTDQLQDAAPGALGDAVTAATKERLKLFLDGIDRYRHHVYRRDLPAPPTAWSQGSTRVFDFAPERTDLKPIVVVPSLVNRSYVLDLSRRRSLMRHLARQGFRPWLVDWGPPGAAEEGFSLDDYILGRLLAIIDLACEQANGPVSMIGYCMGGLLALGATMHRADSVERLALLATPWDFEAGDGAHARLVAAMRTPIASTVTALGYLPIDMLQVLFVATDPAMVPKKFRNFATLDPDGEQARDFVALEDWLNDGVALTGPVARAVFEGWYGDNLTGRGAWTVGDRVVDPSRLTCPALVAAPRRDRIVPPPSARPLMRLIPQARQLQPDTGHVGMIVGHSAPKTLWSPLAEWLRGCGSAKNTL